MWECKKCHRYNSDKKSECSFCNEDLREIIKEDGSIQRAAKVNSHMEKKNSSVQELLNAGVMEKRKGNFKAAEHIYIRCIHIDPLNYWCYYNLAKLLYLTKENLSSIMRYTHAGHIFAYTINKLDKSYYERKIAMFFPKEAIDYFKSVHKNAIAVFSDINLCINLGHSIIDFSNLGDYDDDLKEIIEKIKIIYRQGLMGKQVSQIPEYDEYDNKLYFKVGMDFLKDALRWNDTDKCNVNDLYTIDYLERKLVKFQQ